MDNDFNYVRNNYNKIIDNLGGKTTLSSEDKSLLKDALLMEKLVYDSIYGDIDDEV